MLTTRKLGRLGLTVLIATILPPLVAAAAGAPSTKASAKPGTKSAAKPGAPVAAPKSPITISLTSRIRHGNLVVSVDGVPVFNERFEIPVYAISQTTTWDPVQIVAGKHRLTAKVYGKNGKTYVSGDYDLDVSRTNGIELRIRVKGDKLTVERAS